MPETLPTGGKPYVNHPLWYHWAKMLVKDRPYSEQGPMFVNLEALFEEHGESAPFQTEREAIRMLES